MLLDSERDFKRNKSLGTYTAEAAVDKARAVLDTARTDSSRVTTTLLAAVASVSLIGVALGIAVAVGLARIGSWPALLRPDAVLLAVGFAGAIGVFFGFYPARKAARLNPIDALRYE